MNLERHITMLHRGMRGQLACLACGFFWQSRRVRLSGSFVEPNGHIEFFYTAPGFERQGVASALYREVEKALPGVSLFTEASLAAKPFFMQHGFTVVEWVDVVLLKLARCLDTQNTELLSKEL